MSSDPSSCFHLSVEVVRKIHATAIAKFGGTDGIRSTELLESAVAATQASFGGQSPFTDIVDVAAAYLFYLCSNHPFLDGNKRVALGSCLVFLRLNGIDPAPDCDQWEKLTLEVAASTLTRGETTTRLRTLHEGQPQDS